MASHRYKRFVAASVAALVLGGAALGVASAQQAPGTGTGQSREQAFVDALAKKLNISSAILQQDIQQVQQDQGIPAGEGFFGGHGHGGGGKDLGAAATALNIPMAKNRANTPHSGSAPSVNTSATHRPIRPDVNIV